MAAACDHGVDDPDEDDDTDDDDDNTEEIAMPPAMKIVSKTTVVATKAAPLKKPAAAIVKPVPPPVVAAARKGARAVADPCERPPLSSTPTSYAGGKIYFSESKMAFRVYTRKRGKVETTIKLTSNSVASKRKAWALACAATEGDKRPRVD